MHAQPISLDGTWQFLHSLNDRVSQPVKVRQIVVPGPWQAQFSDIRTRGGTGIYRREVDLPQGWLKAHAYLRFGAVFHTAYVYVNGKLAGKHEGGFLPFGFDVTEYLSDGRNEIKVKVESPTDDINEFPDSPLTEIPFGKQSWYGPLSGIWQSVYLEQRIPDHIERIRIRTSLETGQVRARLVFALPLKTLSSIELRIHGPGGELVEETVHPVEEKQSEFEAVFQLQDVQAWSPDSPALYRLEALIKRGGAGVERVEQTFGFRTIECRGGRLFLNGQPLYLRGALDQDYYPEMISTVPSVAFLEDEFRKAKELGLNCLRCHIKAPDPRYYDVADRVGLLIWTELPNGGISTDRSRARKEATLKGIVDRDGHHPSIIIWTIINENWGVDLVHDAEHRDWLKRTYHWLKAYDPSRLVVDNSPLYPSFHVQTDVADYHFYAAFPDNRRAWDRFVQDLASRPPWLFSLEGDAVQTGQEPLLCSEFGNWGLPDPEQLKDEEGKEPWWFETGHDWGEGIMYPHGIENRFADWSLDRVFGDLSGFVEAAQWQQFRALKYQIEAMRRRPEIGGYVITAFTDTHWESNGLLDMRRNRRAFHDIFHAINADVAIVPRWQRLSYRSGETALLELAIANGGRRIENAVLKISLGIQQTIAVPVLEAGSVLDIGLLSLAMPYVSKPQMRRVGLELTSAEGAVIAQNHLDIALYAERMPPERGFGPVWSPEPDICDYVRALGYEVPARADNASLIIARKYDSDLTADVRNGRRLLLLPESEIALDPFFPHWQSVKVKDREGTLWQGDWASSFAWLKRSGRFSAVPGGPLIDETLDRAIPKQVIAGCNLMDFQSRVSAGLVVGWIHRPVAISVERAYGKGRVLVSTFRLFRDPPGTDPAAGCLFDLLASQILGIESAGVKGALLVGAA
jgi:Glycosyl hydrolases family 2, sugar binding domain/Glycosyl hydrolases family 2/Glycosyl hydrolases family 2, TIM barrel domain